MKEMMTPRNRRWPEFIDRLAGPEGCRFRPGPTWKCSHTHRFTAKILRSMGCLVERSIGFFIANGGFCDCEVVMNVGAKPRRGRPARVKRTKKRISK